MKKIKELVSDEANRLNIFSGKYNNTMLKMCKILDEEIPDKMKRSIANYIMSSFIMHFHFKIELEDKTEVPANIINFILAHSGVKKTSSVNTLEKSLQQGYDVIEEHRQALMVNRAEELAEQNDDDNVAKYITKLNPLFNTISTEAGMIKKLNDFAREGVGTPSLFVDEISTELETNQDIVPNIKLVSQLYDLGNMKTRALKDESMQSDEVKGMAMTCLFIGSEHGLLHEEKTLNKFMNEFISKLARRSFFSYPEFTETVREANDIDEVLNGIKAIKNDSMRYNEDICGLSKEIATRLLSKENNIISITEDAQRVYQVYKLYCEEFSKEKKVEAVQLEFLHRHWKVLKLAGVYSAFNNHLFIEDSDIIEAISIAEDNKDDLARFIEYAQREAYEVMIDVLKIEDKLTYHDCSKHNWIKGANPTNKIQTLVDMANSKLGKEGVIHHRNDEVYLELFTKEAMTASYKVATGTKAERAYKVADGFKTIERSFEELSKLLSNDTAYTPCKFKDGVRGNDNCIGGINFIVLDIDDSSVTYLEVSDMLQDYNFHIAMTSNDDNPYKFRVLLELDITLNIENRLWKPLMNKVKEYTSLNIDILAYSQIYFGFKGREVISNLDGELFPISELIKEIDVPEVKVKKLNTKQRTDALDNKFEEFNYAYEAGGNTRAVYLYRAFRHAKDLGFSRDQVVELLEDIIDYHGNSVDDIYKRTGIDKQIEKAYEGVVF